MITDSGSALNLSKFLAAIIGPSKMSYEFREHSACLAHLLVEFGVIVVSNIGLVQSYLKLRPYFPAGTFGDIQKLDKLCGGTSLKSLGNVGHD